jgi:hypothetical protein
MWRCRCDCGEERIVRRRNLITPGNTVSCGCHRSDVQTHRLRKHGNAGGHRERSKEYTAWQNMIQRCYNPRNKRFKSYGAKGVVVCLQWREDFAAFLADVGPAPTPDSCIDRINPFGNYEPSNIRWIDAKTSNRNRR